MEVQMRLSSPMVVCVLLMTGCSEGDSATAPLSDVALGAAKPRTYEAQLLPLPQGAVSSEAVALNNKGQVVGSVDGNAVRWDPGALPVNLDGLTGDCTHWVLGISDAGDALGESESACEADAPINAVRWPEAGGVQNLGGLLGDPVRGAAISSGG